MKLEKLIKKLNKENAPPDGWSAADAVVVDKGKPEAGKIYALTGSSGTPSIAAGNTWEESEVKDG